MAKKTVQLRKIPGVDTIIAHPLVQSLIEKYDRDRVLYVVRKVVSEIKASAIGASDVPDMEAIVEKVLVKATALSRKSLVNVFNATGIVMHTNLGRAPFSPQLIEDASEVLAHYSNLEFNLNTAKRGSRYDHVSEILKYLTGAEDVLVVNNNAAAIMLILRAFTKNKEVIVSRGELIEIGGSFRLPDILAVSDCKMVEVGTTNKTRLSDFEREINENTGALLKAHPSNYKIQGFTENVKLRELVKLGEEYKIPVFYDMGSGLLQEVNIPELEKEPDVKKTLATGVDLVCFSGDKLLGGPQAGIIAGKAEYVKKLKKDPLVRALRVGKLTLSYLEAVCMQFVDHSKLLKNNYIYKFLGQTKEEIHRKAKMLEERLIDLGIPCCAVQSKAQFGGGALPGEFLESFAVQLMPNYDSSRKKSFFAEKLHKSLLEHQKPVLSVLRKGNVYFDMYCLTEEQIDELSKVIAEAYRAVSL